MAKKKEKVTKTVVSNDNEMAKLIKMVAIIAVLFLIFYGITILVTKNNDKDKETNKETSAEIQYDKILIGNLLTQTNDIYYVLVEDTEDKNNSIYEAYLSVYGKLDKAERIYYAALNNPLNSSFVGTESKTNITNINDLKLKGTTLLKIEKGKITKVYEGKENLIKFLYELSETKEEEKK